MFVEVVCVVIQYHVPVHVFLTLRLCGHNRVSLEGVHVNTQSYLLSMFRPQFRTHLEHFRTHFGTHLGHFRTHLGHFKTRVHWLWKICDQKLT